MSHIVDVSGLRVEHMPQDNFWSPTVQEAYDALGEFIAKGHGALPVIIVQILHGHPGGQAFGRIALGMGALGDMQEEAVAIIVRDEDRCGE